MILLQYMAFESPTLDLDITFFIQTGIFVLLLLFLKKYVLEPYFRAYDEREALTKGAQEEAAHLQAKAVEAKRTYESERQKVYNEVESVRKQEVSAASAAANAVVEQAREKIQRDTQERQAQLDAELKQARERMAPEIEKISQQIADKVLV